MSPRDLAPLPSQSVYVANRTTVTLAKIISPKLQPSDPWSIPFALSDSLRGRKQEPVDSHRFVHLDVPGHDFWMLSEISPEDFIHYIGLRGHNVCTDKMLTQERLTRALRLIGEISAVDLEIISLFAPTWGYLECADEQNCRVITSCSLPDLPFMSFLSSMAWRHIPPRSIASFESDYFAAENIVHEAVHQRVNFVLLSEPVLSAEYDSRKSAKIDIPWRSDAGEARNRSWEIDRALHAAFVYTYLLSWRTSLLDSALLTSRERDIFAAALNSSYSSLDVLTVGLKENISTFTPYGGMLVGQLLSEVARWREDGNAGGRGILQ